jgi:hypothetical protein
MRFYSTQYRLQDPSDSNKRVLYNSSIYASNYRTACKLASMRGIHEFVIGTVGSQDFDPCPLPSTFYQNRKMMDCLHTLTFYSFIGTTSGVIKSAVMLSDVGLLHEIMHEMHHPEFYSFRVEILNRLLKLESMIPGLKTFIIPANFDSIEFTENI